MKAQSALLMNEKRTRYCSFWIAVFVLLPVPSFVEAVSGEEPSGDIAMLSAPSGTGDLSGVGSDELLLFTDIPAIEITSVSKREEKLLETPAAVYVVTAEDIRRSGATSVMEALRMVPGVFVGRASSDIWAISARGFARQFATKLLVLIDGRSIYTPLYAGVHWYRLDMAMDTIDRIEVIRGPGSTLWGANAVNGVINIITKKAKDTQGWYLSGGAGSEIVGTGTVRYGGKLNDHSWFRVFSKYSNRDHYGDLQMDSTSIGHGGFRFDSDLSKDDSLTLMSEYEEGGVSWLNRYYRLTDPLVTYDQGLLRIKDNYTLGRWRHAFSPTSAITIQTYFHHLNNTTAIGGEIRDTYDFDMQHNVKLGDVHELVWGVGYRHARTAYQQDPLPGTFIPYSMTPDHQHTDLYSGFIQDEIALVTDRLKLIVGSKFEHNDYTGFEYQPSGRLVWTPDKKNTFWGAISRAVRTPSWADDNIVINQVFDAGGGVPGWFTVHGSHSAVSEELMAYELGYRSQLREDVFVDLATFLNEYDHLTDARSGATTYSTDPSPHLSIPTYFDNIKHGHTWGFEASANWNVTKDWRLSGGYSFIDIWLNQVNPNTRGFFDSEGSTPQNQVNLRSYLNLPHHVELDTMLYYVDNLSEESTAHYLRCDVRLGWKMTENIELSLAGYNLLDPYHKEYGTADELSEVPRSIYGQVTIRF